MAKLDALGRATFHHIASHEAVRPTNRELRWLAHIERHGPQSSVALLELTSDTHRCRDTGLRSLQRLRAAKILALPPQQRTIARADFHPYIYDTTPLARAYLGEIDFIEPTVRPTGHFWHTYTTAALTSAVDRVAARSGLTYVPAHTILTKRKVPLGIPIPTSTVVPDQLFALNYGGAYRTFLLEVDRGTEPITGQRHRESLHRKLAAYSLIFARDLHREHYGLKSPIALLFAFTYRHRAERVISDITRHWPNLAPVTLIKTIDPFDPLLLKSTTYVATPWQRGSGGTMSLFQS
jgi:hypothetical protein